MTEQIFEWDRRKAAANVGKHGIDFNEAREVFFDPLKKLEMEGMEHGEIRWRSVGEAFGRLLVVSHTLEEGGEIETVRIISARKATRRERRAYEGQA